MVYLQLSHCLDLSGNIYGVTPGVVVVSYTTGSGTATMPVTITAMPTITGPLSVCIGSTITLTGSPAGGTWMSGSPAVATVGSSTGIVTGVSSGLAPIDYTAPGGCWVGTYDTVGTGATSVTGPTTTCVGSTLTLSATPGGGTWSSSNPAIGTVTPGGAVTGLSAGTAVITFVPSGGCSSSVLTTVTFTATASAGTISGTMLMCLGSSSLLTSTATGGTWSSSSPGIASIASTTGMVTAVSAGTAIITYTTSACGGATTTAVVTVSTTASTISVSSTPVSCGAGTIITASGATTYSWSPATLLSCSTCATTISTAISPTTYVVTGSSSGCSGSATITVGGDNTIRGKIYLSSGLPSSSTCKVWLVQFNPADSSITGIDSTTTCVDATGNEFYHFDGKPGGTYFVKSKLLSSIAGTSGYVPTYGTASINWYAAYHIGHGTGTDERDIFLQYGTVPAGPGFISGYVYAGAGRGTSGEAPVEGMLIYLRNSAGTLLTYTYTDATGMYKFNNLAYGSYVIYPEEYKYSTISSAVTTLSAATPNASGVTFKQYTNLGIIKPFEVPNVLHTTSAHNSINVFPNPASGKLFVQWNGQQNTAGTIAINDFLGRLVLSATFTGSNTTNIAPVDISGLAKGMYSISVQAADINYNSKLVVE